MEHLLSMYFKDRPAMLQAWYRLRPVLVNVMILCSICISILARNESVRSFTLGLAAGIVLINLGQHVTALRSAEDRNKSVNG